MCVLDGFRARFAKEKHRCKNPRASPLPELATVWKTASLTRPIRWGRAAITMGQTLIPVQESGCRKISLLSLPHVWCCAMRARGKVKKSGSEMAEATGSIHKGWSMRVTEGWQRVAKGCRGSHLQSQRWLDQIAK